MDGKKDATFQKRGREEGLSIGLKHDFPNFSPSPRLGLGSSDPSGMEGVVQNESYC